MSYQENSSVASINQLLSQLKNFLVADGWTVDSEVNTGSNPTLAVHKGTVSAGFAYSSSTSSLGITGGVVGVVTSPSAICQQLNGTFTTVWFFSDPSKNYCHVVATKGNGEFIHFSFGWVDNLGYSTHTVYATGQKWDLTTPNLTQQATLNVPAFLNQYGLAIPSGVLNTAFAPSGDISTSSVRQLINMDRFKGDSIFPFEGTIIPSYSILDYVIDMSNSPTTGGVHLHSIPIIAVLSTYDHTLGLAPDVRLCCISDLADGQEIANSGDTWKVFPLRRRGLRSSLSGGSNPIVQTNSLNLGLAYKKVP